MKKFKHINIDKRVFSIAQFLRIPENNYYFNLLKQLDQSQNEKFLKDALIGFKPEINIFVTGTKSSAFFARDKDIQIVSSLINYQENKYSVDGIFYNDLTGIEQTIFEDQIKLNIFCLAVPFSEDDLNSFLNALD